MSSTSSYYQNINYELLNICPQVSSVIEFGCGEGQFLEAYKNSNPHAKCVGFELSESAANIATTKLDEVIIGNAEELGLASFGYREPTFELLIYGDVLEHFVDPWAALKLHIRSLKPGGYVCACIPNISHWSMIFKLINGSFEYEDSGLLDRTHLRFFTKSSIVKMFEDVGLEIDILVPRKYQSQNTDEALKTLARTLMKPVQEISPRRLEEWRTYQYLIRARAPKA